MVELDFRAADWPSTPLDAADHFYSDILPQVREALDPESEFWRSVGEVPDVLDAAVLLFPHADNAHDAWRIAAVQDIAREITPKRVNAVVAGEDDDLAEVIDYLRGAPGITGQILTMDGNSGEKG